MENPPELRYELKIVLPEGYLPRLRSVLRQHPCALRRQHPERWVNSLYFDTESLARLGQNHAGQARRAKLRYRWYGEAMSGLDGVLEIKHRRGRLGHKDLFPVPGDLGLDQHDWSRIFRSLQDAIPEEAQLALRAFSQPVLINRYRRRYLSTPDHQLRVTVDEEQQFFGQWGTRRPNLRHATPPIGELVVEIKASKQAEDRTRSLIEALPWSLSRNSKYVNGCHRQVLLG